MYLSGTDLIREVKKTINDRRLVTRIQQTVAEAHGISVEDLVSKSRKQELVYSRFIAFYFCRNLTNLCLADIGKAFNRDHATVLHGVRSHSFLTNYKDYLKQYLKVINRLEADGILNENI